MANDSSSDAAEVHIRNGRVLIWSLNGTHIVSVVASDGSSTNATEMLPPIVLKMHALAEPPWQYCFSSRFA